MTILNYRTLKERVLKWTHRKDLLTEFDTFLQLCEAEIYSNPDESLKLLSLDQIATTSMQVDSRFLALPSGMNYQRKLTITVDNYDYKLTYVSPGNLQPQEDFSGIPTKFTISDNQIEFDKLPDEEYVITINYQSSVEGLSPDNETNEILNRYPNVYFYGCLAQAFTYTQQTDQEQKYSQYFISAIRDANKREREIKYPVGVNIKPARIV